MTKRLSSPLARAAQAYATERQWMEDHGWTRAAYIARYGTTEAPKLGDGGELIWEADFNVFHETRARLFELYPRFREHERTPEIKASVHAYVHPEIESESNARLNPFRVSPAD